jgi:hypothetical protein
MYSNVTNINLNDNPLSTQSPQVKNQAITLDTNHYTNSNSNNSKNNVNINDHLKLDINDFVVSDREDKKIKNLGNK